MHSANGRLRRSRGPSSAGSRRVEASHPLAQLCNSTQLLCITFMWFHCSVHIRIYQYGHDHTHRMHKYACHSPIVTCKHMNLQGGMTLRMHIFTHYNSSHVYQCQRISYTSLKNAHLMNKCAICVGLMRQSTQSHPVGVFRASSRYSVRSLNVRLPSPPR